MMEAYIAGGASITPAILWLAVNRASIREAKFSGIPLEKYKQASS
jgi:hypothetical protein